MGVIYIYTLQESLCTLQKLECVENIKIDTSSCLKPCTGLIVTSLSKSKSEQSMKNLHSLERSYNLFKKKSLYPEGSVQNSPSYPSMPHI